MGLLESADELDIIHDSDSEGVINPIEDLEDISQLNCVDVCNGENRYVEVYDNAIMPTNGRDEWRHIEAIPPVPPKLKRTVGRPPKARRRDREEPELRQRKRGRGRPVSTEGYVKKRNQEIVTCSKCGVAGHNRRSCPTDIHQVLVDCGLADLGNEAVFDEIFNDVPTSNAPEVVNDNNQEMVNDVPESQDEPLSQLTQMTQNDTQTDVVERGGSRVKYDRACKLRDANDGSGGSTTYHIRPILDKGGKKFVMPTKIRQVLHREKSAQNLWKK
ncbi:hypothetical protein ACS0TY_021571 [Phlomoides rotata]